LSPTLTLFSFAVTVVTCFERLVLALTDRNDYVLDPYMGVGTAMAAAVLHDRRAIGAEIVPDYVSIAKDRVLAAVEGSLPRRPMGRPIYEPPKDSPITMAPWRK
jgi:adenine-specific DNA-methyltransferase